jgi:hypothetical protein
MVAPERRSIWRAICAMMLCISPLGLAMAGVFTLASALLLHTLAGMLVFATPVASFAASELCSWGVSSDKSEERQSPLQEDRPANVE